MSEIEAGPYPAGFIAGKPTISGGKAAVPEYADLHGGYDLSICSV